MTSYQTLQVIRHQSVILTVIGVYMPYFSGNIDQTQQYIETLELLQDLLHTYSSGTPCMIKGDFNAALSQHSTL